MKCSIKSKGEINCLLRILAVVTSLLLDHRLQEMLRRKRASYFPRGKHKAGHTVYDFDYLFGCDA